MALATRLDARPCHTYVILGDGELQEGIILVFLPQLNVKVAAAYGGLSDSSDGATHQSVEDIAIARALPNMNVDIESTSVCSISGIST